MASVNIADVLGAPQLCGTIQGTTTGIPNVFPGDPVAETGFYVRDKVVEKDYGEYKRVTGTRTTAKLAAYGSPSQTAQLKDVENVPVKLLHAVENIHIPLFDYTSIVEKDRLVIDADGVQEIGRQVAEFRKRFDNLRVAALTSALSLGAIYYDGLGNLLPSSSGAKTTVDFAIPAGNKDQLDVLGAGNIIDVSWDDTSADIHKQILGLKQAARRKTGYPLRYAFYGKNVPDYLVSNTTLKDFFIRNSAQNTQFLTTAEIPNPLLGLTWLPAYEAFFEDKDGTNQSLWDDDRVVFTPEPSLDWIGWLLGKYLVPTTLSVADDATALVRGNVKKVAGMFAYATLTTDPVAAKMVAGDTQLPVIRVPGAVFIADVKFSS